MNSAPDALEDAWRSTCKTIFGREIGPLEKFGPYLHEAVFGMKAQSAFGGGPVVLASDAYAKGSRFFDDRSERAQAGRLDKPLDLNAIKDLDSLVSGLQERLAYGANKELGKCEGVENSDAVFDSLRVRESTYVARSKDVAHSFWVRDSDRVFGGASFGFCTSIIRSYYGMNLRRTFECTVCESLADSMFCYNTLNCSDLLFCFNLRNQHRRIANIALDKETYAKRRAELVEQIAGELEQKGRLDFSMMDILG